MQLGSRIQKYRKGRGLSQEQLADLLSVSRQSISKWETDAAVPELEKLLRMSDIFGVSLDALVREDTEPPATPPIPTAPPTVSARPAPPHKTTGIILLCTAAVLFVLLTVLGGIVGGLLFASPFLATGLICLFVRRHVGLLSGWTLYVLTDIYLTYATGASRGAVLAALRYPEYIGNPRILIVSWIWVLLLLLLYVCTLISFRKMERTADRKTVIQMLLSGILPFLSTGVSLLVTRIYERILHAAQASQNAQLLFEAGYIPYSIAQFVLSWISILAVACFLTLLCARLRHRKNHR